MSASISLRSLSASWLLDLFGEYRRSKESAGATLDAAYASADVAKLTYLSSVVSAYIDARYYQERIAVARKSLASRRETVLLTGDHDLPTRAAALSCAAKLPSKASPACPCPRPKAAWAWATSTGS